MKYQFKTQIGIMQGRLTETKGRGIQFFPFENWENEFKVGKGVGIKEIEFIFDYNDYKNKHLQKCAENEKYSLKNLGTIRSKKYLQRAKGISINLIPNFSILDSMVLKIFLFSFKIESFSCPSNL